MELCLGKPMEMPCGPLAVSRFCVILDAVEASAKRLFGPRFVQQATRKSVCVSTDAIKKNSPLWLAELTDVDPTVMGDGLFCDFYIILRLKIKVTVFRMRSHMSVT